MRAPSAVVGRSVDVVGVARVVCGSGSASEIAIFASPSLR
ncbi:hypothetical protein [Conyzicola nivalis]